MVAFPNSTHFVTLSGSQLHICKVLVRARISDVEISLLPYAKDPDDLRNYGDHLLDLLDLKDLLDLA